MKLIKKYLHGNPMAYSSYVSGDTKKAINEGTKKVASAFNTAMGWLGEMLTGPISGMTVPAGTASGAWSYSQSPHYARNVTTLQPAAKKLIEENAVYVSPSSHIAAWTQGSLDPKKGAEVLASDPRLLSLGIIGDLATLKYGPKVIKGAPKAVVKAVAKTGNKTAKKIIVALEINKAVKNTSPKVSLPINTEISFINNTPSKSRTSLAFFERKPSRISASEKAGVPREERFVKPFRVANYPGYLLKGLMKGSLLEKQLSKNGTISINLLNSYFNKASLVEREVANKVLAEKFAGQKTINYNLFKKAILDELIGSYNRVPLTKWADYGMEGLGFNLKSVGENELPGLPNLIILGLPVHYIPPGTKADPISLSTFTFESPRIPYGNTKHYGGNPLGHSRTYTTPDEPNVLHVIESLSDWGQSSSMGNFAKKYFPTDEEINSHNIRILGRLEKQVDPKHIEEFLKLKYYALKVGVDNLETVVDKFSPEFIEYINDKFSDPFPGWPAQLRLASLRFKKAERSNFRQASYLHDNYLQRQLQENLRYAAENGLTKMRYPTPETAAKIEGYQKTKVFIPKAKSLLDDLNKSLAANEKIIVALDDLLRPDYFDTYGIKLSSETENLLLLYRSLGNRTVMDFSPSHKTILKKYADFPKLFLKLYKDLKVRTVIDTKGNTWYEVDVPKGYLSREWQFKQGGILKYLTGNPIVYEYLKAIENPDSVGWDGKVWKAPTIKGFDKNQRAFGLDVVKNEAVRKLTEGRPGRWLTDSEATKLMNDHIDYVNGAATRHIKGFTTFSPKRLAALLGMLYRGDSVNKSGINLLEPNDNKFFKSISDYYRKIGFPERANNSDKFFNVYKKGGKAFVPEVNVLDSNPDIRKKKKLKKAAEGTKMSVGLWLNSDTGLVFTNLGMLLWSGIQNNYFLNKVKKDLEQWKSSYLKSLDDSLPDFTLLATQMEKEELQDGQNASPISIAKKNWDLLQQYRLKMLALASIAADLLILNLLSNLLKLTNSGWGDILSTGLGIAGQFLSKKNDNSLKQTDTV